jgi:solute carrier family 25 carnitine/acylcarnitine transporter 20/29
MGIEKELELTEHGLQRTLKDLFSGAVGGVAQVLLGMYLSIAFRNYAKV